MNSSLNTLKHPRELAKKVHGNNLGVHRRLRWKAKRMNVTPTQTNPQDLRSPNRRPAGTRRSTAHPDPRVPGSPVLSPAPVGSAAAQGTEAAGAGTPRSPAWPVLASQGSPAAPGRTGQPAPYGSSAGAAPGLRSARSRHPAIPPRGPLEHLPVHCSEPLPPGCLTEAPQKASSGPGRVERRKKGKSCRSSRGPCLY